MTSLDRRGEEELRGGEDMEGGMGEKPFFLFVDRRLNHPPLPVEATSS